MMATRERPRQRPDEPLEHDDELAFESLYGLDADITDEDIEEYLEEQAEEAEQKQKKPGFLNLQTGAGIALIAIGTVYLLQQLGFFPLGYSLGALVAFLPWLAGILIILTGFGVLSWSPSRRRRRQRKQARQRRARAAKAAKTAGRARSARRDEPARRGVSAFELARRSAERAMREAERRTARAFSRSSERASERRESRKRLTKSRRNKKIAGVASGIAEYLGVDPILIRIAFVIGAIFGNGFTIPLYIILAFVMPSDDRESDDDDDPVITVVRDR